MPSEGGGRDWTDASTRQGMPRVAGPHWKQERSIDEIRPHNPLKMLTHLTHRFQSPEVGDEMFLSF